MKKLFVIALVGLLAFAAWYSILDYDMVVHIGDEDWDGPFGALVGMLAAGSGLVIAAIAITCAAVFVGFVFAGVGILLVIGLALLAVVLVVAIAPLTLPVLIPLAIIWWIARRNRQRDAARKEPVLEQPIQTV